MDEALATEEWCLEGWVTGPGAKGLRRVKATPSGWGLLRLAADSELRKRMAWNQPQFPAIARDSSSPRPEYL